MLALPGLPDKGDVSDWLEAGGTAEQLESLADQPPLRSPDHGPAGDGALEDEDGAACWTNCTPR